MNETYSLHFEDGKVYIFKMVSDGLLKPCDRSEERAMFSRPVKIEGATAYLAPRYE